jgi:glycosyltransferase involved in cell wall biosynthesis
MPMDEIVIVDDCSTDNTEVVVRDLMVRDPRIRYYKLQKNGGHLAALSFGANKAVSDWIVLLDADDELTPTSIEARVAAAKEYENATGIKPQLVYGDHEGTQFARLKGYVFHYLCKELCLCQTSTMMLGKECIPYLPITDNWLTDDEIVLAIGKHFHVVHSGAAVTIYHTHNSPTRMGNSPKKRLTGVWKLVGDHRADIIREQGIGRLLLWWLRLLRAFINYHVALANSWINATPPTKRWQCLLLRVYRRGLIEMSRPLKFFLKRHFDYDFF